MIKIESKSRAFLLLIAFGILAVHSLKAQSKLNEYIKEALASNQSIKQQTFML